MGQIRQFARVSDAVILSLAKDLTQEFANSAATMVVGDQAQFAINPENPQPPEALGSIFGPDTYSIHSVHFYAPDLALTIAYTRNINLPFVDQIEITGSNTQQIEVAGKVWRCLNRHLNMAAPIAVTGDGQQALAQSASMIAEINGVALRLVEHTAARQAELDQLRTRLEEHAAERVTQQADELNTKYQEKLAALETKQAELDKREAELDDRVNTHVRRDIQNRMRDLVDTRLQTDLLNSSSRAFKSTFNWTLGATILLAGLFFADLTIPHLLGMDVGVAQWWIQGRGALLSIGIVSLIWFGLRQSVNRYRQINHWEQELQRFRLDTERAGFLVEGDLEARLAGQTGLPEVLLESFSRNLFSAHTSGDHSDDLGGALQQLLGNSSRISIGTDGFRADVGPRGIRKAKKALGPTDPD